MESWLNLESEYYDGHSGCNYVKWNVTQCVAYYAEPNHSNVYSLEASVCCWHWIMKAASKNEFHTISKWLLTFEKQSFDLSSRQVGTKDVLLSCKKML